MWGNSLAFGSAIRFGPADAMSDRVRRTIRNSKAAKNVVRAQYEAQGYRVTPRSPRKGGADFDVEGFDLWRGVWVRETVKVKTRSGTLTKKQRAEKRRVERAGGKYTEKRVKSLWPFF